MLVNLGLLKTVVHFSSGHFICPLQLNSCLKRVLNDWVTKAHGVYGHFLQNAWGSSTLWVLKLQEGHLCLNLFLDTCCSRLRLLSNIFPHHSHIWGLGSSWMDWCLLRLFLKVNFLGHISHAYSSLTPRNSFPEGLSMVCNGTTFISSSKCSLTSRSCNSSLVFPGPSRWNSKFQSVSISILSSSEAKVVV